jgi:hypothetical protein
VELDDSGVGQFCGPETPIAVYVDGEEYEVPREIERPVGGRSRS